MLFRSVLLVLGGVLWRLSPRDPRARAWVPLALAALAVTAVAVGTRPRERGPYAVFDEFEGAGAVDLERGTKAVVFASASCEHCAEVARELSTLRAQDAAVYLVILGSPAEGAAFVRANGVPCPWRACTDPERFFAFIDPAPAPPRVVLLHDGEEQRSWTASTWDLAAFREAWQEHE